jgi:hypothetical protein
MNTKHDVEPPTPIRTVRGEFGEGLAELVERKVATIARHAHEPVLAIRVELDRHTYPAVADPVTATLNIEVCRGEAHTDQIPLLTTTFGSSGRVERPCHGGLWCSVASPREPLSWL